MIEILVPTRGRPATTLNEVNNSFYDTKTLEDTGLVFIADYDDETWISGDGFEYDNETRIFVGGADQPVGLGIGAALNHAAFAGDYVNKADILGFSADDVRFKTKGWDAAIAEALKDGGIAWCNDGANGELLANHWMVSTDIIKALGWFAVPACRHFFTDNAWTEIAKGADCLHYLGDYLMEHLHWSFGKSEKDTTYVNAERVGSGDDIRYHNWIRSGGLEESIKIVKETLLNRGNA